MAQWHYSINGVQNGPVEDAEMRAMMVTGMIHSGTLVWKEGMDTWLPLNRHPDWMAETASPAGTALPGQGADSTNGMAIASLVCGLLSLMMGILAAIPAVICGHIALSQLKESPMQPGRGFAIIGLVFGYLIVVGTICLVVFFGSFIFNKLG